MKRLLLFSPFLVLIVLAQGPLPAAPLEFYAVVQDKEPVDSATTKLEVRLTPDFTLSVRVTDATMLSNREGLPIGIDEINVGDLIAVQAVHTEAGLLALKIQKQEPGSAFELKGSLESVQAAGDDSSIVVLGLTLVVTSETRIREARRELTVDELAELHAAATTPLQVKVSGTVKDAELVAETIHVQGPELRFARINLEGTIAEFKSDAAGGTYFLLDIGGGVQVQVRIVPETRLIGDPVVGSFVRVQGLLSPDLGVTALNVHVLRLWDAVPPRLEMDLEASRELNVVVRRPFDFDLEFVVEVGDLVSIDPVQVVIPAGELNATIHVTSGNTVGETVLTIQAPPELGGDKRTIPILVGPRPTPLPRPQGLAFAPPVVHSVPGSGTLTVQLLLVPGPSPSDQEVSLQLHEASPDLKLTFPEEVTLPAGATGVPVELKFESRTGTGKLIAVLGGQGGEPAARAALNIELRPPIAPTPNPAPNPPLLLRWKPETVRIPVSGSAEARLHLNAPAPSDMVVTITIGPELTPALPIRIGFPAEVRFRAGSREATVEFKAGDQPGRVRLTAALPRSVGGGAAGIEVHVFKP